MTPHESKCMGKGCRSKAVRKTLKGYELCPTCFERAKDKDFEVKKKR